MVDKNDEEVGKSSRKFVRVHVRLTARIMIEGDPAEKIFHATTRNISRGGLCLCIDEDKIRFMENIGDEFPRLKVSLHFAGAEDRNAASTEEIWISGVVGWLLKPADTGAPIVLGMKFSDLRLMEAEKISAFITGFLRKRRDTSFDRKKDELLSRIAPKSPGKNL